MLCQSMSAYNVTLSCNTDEGNRWSCTLPFNPVEPYKNAIGCIFSCKCADQIEAQQKLDDMIVKYDALPSDIDRIWASLENLNYRSEWFIKDDEAQKQYEKEQLQTRINNDVKMYDRLPLRI